MFDIDTMIQMQKESQQEEFDLATDDITNEVLESPVY